MAIVDETRYKSNSHRSRMEEEQREIQKVTKGSVRRHEKTTLEKFKEQAFGNYSGNLLEDFVFDVLVPSGKELFDIALTNAKDMFLYGEIRTDSRNRNRRGGGTYVSYDGISRKSRQRDREYARRARFDFSDIEFDDLDDIDDVIKELEDVWALCPHPKEISVAQFYQAAGVEVRPTDNNWGWIDIRVFTNADPYKVRTRNPRTGEVEEKWVLNLPKPKPLDY